VRQVRICGSVPSVLGGRGKWNLDPNGHHQECIQPNIRNNDPVWTREWPFFPPWSCRAKATVVACSIPRIFSSPYYCTSKTTSCSLRLRKVWQSAKNLVTNQRIRSKIMQREEAFLFLQCSCSFSLAMLPISSPSDMLSTSTPRLRPLERAWEVKAWISVLRQQAQRWDDLGHPTHLWRRKAGPGSSPCYSSSHGLEVEKREGGHARKDPQLLWTFTCRHSRGSDRWKLCIKNAAALSLVFIVPLYEPLLSG